MFLNEDKLWAGSEENFRSVLTAETAVMAKISADVASPTSDRILPRLLSIDNGLATITIKGGLVNSDSPWLEFFGLTGYPEIRDALLAAAQDSSVQQILLDIESGGGAVSGVADTAAMIRAINDKVKPVTTYADFMASAAIWLGASAGKVYAGKTAMVGSIGVIATFKEYTKANEMNGVTVTVIRAGSEKALANSNEKLTPKAEAQIQAQVDASYQIFVEHIAEMRGVTYAVADKKMADGKEFIGKAAVDAGLIDGISSFDAVVSDLQGKILANKEKLMHNRGNGGKTANSRAVTSTGESNMPRQALSEQDIAALAAGGAAGGAVGIEASAEAAAAEAQAAAAAAAAEAQATAGQGAEGSAAEAGAAEAAGTESVVGEELATLKATVQLLNSQMSAKDEAVLQANLKLAKMQERVDEMGATHATLLDIAAKSVSNMSVALNGPVFKVEGMTATLVIAEHARISEQFQSKFKVGGVAAVSSDKAATDKPQVSPRHLARVNAARYQPK